MNLVDANVLIYAVNSADVRHDEARKWLDGALTSGGEGVGFGWSALLAFLRLATHPSVFARPLEVADAIAVMRGWIHARNAVIVQETPRHFEVLASLLESSGTGGNLTSDAHLAALALEHRATVRTYDSDFGRFAGVRWAPPG